MSELTIIGAGLAGAEAAWQAANRGVARQRGRRAERGNAAAV